MFLQTTAIQNPSSNDRNRATSASNLYTATITLTLSHGLVHPLEIHP